MEALANPDLKRFFEGDGRAGCFRSRSLSLMIPMLLGFEKSFIFERSFVFSGAATAAAGGG